MRKDIVKYGNQEDIDKIIKLAEEFILMNGVVIIRLYLQIRSMILVVKKILKKF